MGVSAAAASTFARSQATRLVDLVKNMARTSAFWKTKLGDFDPARLVPENETGAIRDLLDRLPFTTKAEIEEDQAAHPPFGTLLCGPLPSFVRVHQTSGTSGKPIVWPDTSESWDWVVSCWEKVYRGVGLEPGDRVFFPFSFGPFLGFWSAFEAAPRCGAMAVPGGGMSTVARLEAILDRKITVVAATPTYAMRMAEVAREEGIDLARSEVRAVIVAGEPGGSLPSVRARIESAWGARVFDHAGMTEIGPFAYECLPRSGGLHVIEEEFIAEALEPGGSRRVEDGETGELVLTNLGRTSSPLLRYRTGDLVRFVRGPCACGSLRVRLEGGILGRVDDMAFIRGNNVFPSAVDAILRRFSEVVEYRVRILRRAEMTDLTLDVEVAPGEPAGEGGVPELSRRIVKAFEAGLLFRPGVVIVPPGTLPRFELKARRWFVEGGRDRGGR